MKGIFLIISGLGDLEIPQFKGKTPLQVAHTPNLDFLATRGEMGYMYPVRPNYSPERDESIVSIFGNELRDSSRGQLEARGAGIKLRRGDIALRVNFATIDDFENGNIKNERIGRMFSTREIKRFSRAINKIEFPYEFDFVPTTQYGAVLVIHGNFSNKIAGLGINYISGKSEAVKKVVPCKAMIRSEEAKNTVEVLNEFLRLSYEVLKNHPANKRRIARGLLPANYLLICGPGVEKPKLKQYKNWISAHLMPLEIGFSRLSGMKNYSTSYPKMWLIKPYNNLWKGLKKGIKHSKKIISKNLNKADYFYVHLNETDLPGHDNKPITKKNMIEYIDKIFIKYLRNLSEKRKLKIVVTGDHSTPCKLKNHSADPVPVLFYYGKSPMGEKKYFNEVEARKGKLGRIMGKELFKKVGFV